MPTFIIFRYDIDKEEYYIHQEEWKAENCDWNVWFVLRQMVKFPWILELGDLGKNEYLLFYLLK